MKLRKTKKVAASVVASAAMVAGLAVAGTGTAAAADSYKGPELKVEQGDFDGKNVELTLTNPNVWDSIGDGSSCTSALLDGAQGLEAFVAYNNKDFGKLIDIMLSPGLRLGPAASNGITSHGPNSDTKTVKVDNGVYIYLGTCGGIKSLEPGNVGVSLKPVIVPSGIGSIEPGLAFGSTVLESGADLAALLPLLGSLAGGAGAGS
ncbi:hypothetical protein [Prescottella subtropica]|uniref:hypothetical protein n=1 Tax=Prescottella subtropica TaxID=2545757 RepID=UPI0010F6F350|nr:hypothetical protein [Prescottella subtropica]